MVQKQAPKIKIKLKRSQKLTKVGQIIYLTCSNFQNNDLWQSASACSFGFLFSFIPLALIILTAMVGIIRVSPEILDYIMAFSDEIESIVDIKPLINNIVYKNNFHIVDIFLAFWIIWMARRLFLSIVRAMYKIFNSVVQRKGIINQALIFISEFIIAILIAAIVLFVFSFTKLVSSDIFEPLRAFLPDIVNQNSHTIVTLIMYFVIFIGTFLAYRLISGTKPPVKLCLLYSLLNALCFFFVSIFVSKFMNLTNYNIVYGAISTIILLMMKVYFFFIFFLFFAQMIYVSQYLDLLLQSEIYLLPTQEQKGTLVSLRRILFINPAALKTTTNTKNYKQGELIFNKGDNVNSVFYIRKGTIEEKTDSKTIIYTKGNFVGDTLCLTNQPYNGTAIAQSDCKLIVFTSDEFKELMQKSPKAAAKALSKLSEK